MNTLYIDVDQNGMIGSFDFPAPMGAGEIVEVRARQAKAIAAYLNTLPSDDVTVNITWNGWYIFLQDPPERFCKMLYPDGWRPDTCRIVKG